MAISTSGVSFTKWKETNPEGTYDQWRKAAPVVSGDYPTLKFKDFDGRWHEFTPNLAQGLTRQGNWGTTLQPLANIQAFYTQPDSFLDPNMSKERRGYQDPTRGDISFRSMNDIAWDRFDDPELAKSVLESYQQARQAVAQNIGQIVNKYGGEQGIIVRTKDSAGINPDVLQEILQPGKDVTGQWVGATNGGQNIEAAPEPSEQGTGGTATRTLETGTGENFTAAYNRARQEDPTLTLDEFRNRTTDVGTVTGNNMTEEDTYLSQILSNMQTSQSEALEKMATLIADSIGVLTPEQINELTPQDIENISKTVEAEYGDYFTTLKNQAQEDFSMAQRFAQENLQTTFGQTKEDVGVGRQRIARNFSEAMMDTQQAMANRSLSYGAARGEAEKRLDLTRQEQLRDLETSAKRQLEGSQTSFERQFGTGALPTLPSTDFFGGTGLGEKGTEVIGQERNLRNIGLEEGATLESEKRAREQELFNTLNPQVFS